MKIPVSCVVAFALLCGGGGMAAGYKLALISEHNRLEHNKSMVRLSHEKVWSQSNTEAAVGVARQIYAPDFVVHDWTGDSSGGLDGLTKDLAENRANFPDWSERVESIVAEGDFVAARFLSTGTQGRDLAAVPHLMPAIPSQHRLVHMPEMELFRISNGKLAEQWDLSDGWGANVQLGLFDPDHWPKSDCGSAQSL